VRNSPAHNFSFDITGFIGGSGTTNTTLGDVRNKIVITNNQGRIPNGLLPDGIGESPTIIRST